MTSSSLSYNNQLKQLLSNHINTYFLSTTSKLESSSKTQLSQIDNLKYKLYSIHDSFIDTKHKISVSSLPIPTPIESLYSSNDLFSRDNSMIYREDMRRNELLKKIQHIKIESHCLKETESYKMKKNEKKERSTTPIEKSAELRFLSVVKEDLRKDISERVFNCKVINEDRSKSRLKLKSKSPVDVGEYVYSKAKNGIRPVRLLGLISGDKSKNMSRSKEKGRVKGSYEIINNNRNYRNDVNDGSINKQASRSRIIGKRSSNEDSIKKQIINKEREIEIEIEKEKEKERQKERDKQKERQSEIERKIEEQKKFIQNEKEKEKERKSSIIKIDNLIKEESQPRVSKVKENQQEEKSETKTENKEKPKLSLQTEDKHMSFTENNENPHENQVNQDYDNEENSIDSIDSIRNDSLINNNSYGSINNSKSNSNKSKEKDKNNSQNKEKPEKNIKKTELSCKIHELEKEYSQYLEVSL